MSNTISCPYKERENVHPEEWSPFCLPMNTTEDTSCPHSFLTKKKDFRPVYSYICSNQWRQQRWNTKTNFSRQCSGLHYPLPNVTKKTTSTTKTKNYQKRPRDSHLSYPHIACKTIKKHQHVGPNSNETCCWRMKGTGGERRPLGDIAKPQRHNSKPRRSQR